MPALTGDEKMQFLFSSAQAAGKEGRLGPALMALESMIPQASPYNQYVTFFQMGVELRQFGCYALAAQCFRRARELGVQAGLPDGGAQGGRAEAECQDAIGRLCLCSAFRPDTLIQEVSSFCNFSCPKCPHRTMKRPPSHLDPDRFFSFLRRWGDLVGEFGEIIFTGGGEILMNPRFVEIVRGARTVMPRTRLTAASNLALLREDQARELADLGLVRWEVSLDSCDREEYAAITGRDVFDEVVKNLTVLWTIIKDRPSRYLEIAAHRPFDAVFEEKMKAIRAFAADFSSDFRAAPYTTLMGRIPGEAYTLWEKTLDRNSGHLQLCAEPWRLLVVTAEGEVRRCCSDMFDCPEEEALGNVFTEDLANTIFSEKRTRLQKEMAFGRYDGLYLCKQCYIPYYDVTRGYR